MQHRTKAAWFAGLLMLAVFCILMFGHKTERVRLLYASSGDSYDRAAYLNFDQSLLTNSEVTRLSLDGLKLKQLQRYDAVYLDVSLKQTASLEAAIPELQAYVEQGGHLFVENDLLQDIPMDLLGAAAIRPVSFGGKPQFGYPAVRGNLQELQHLFRQFAETFTAHVTDMGAEMPGFHWGQAIVPSTAERVVTLNGQAVYTVNRYGQGTVFAAGAFLPNRYFITGFDLSSGMDPQKGFSSKVAKHNETAVGQPGRSHYFDFKTGLPQEPYFHFGFAAANHLFRNEYLAYVSKENLGYSMKKIMGPYGRPAMAYQNHFEALPAFEHREGIAWAELLKTYNQIPSFSLIRASFDWYKWYESVVIHLNTGTSEKPQFIGELPNSFYSSGVPLMSDGSPLTLATYPEKRELATKLELPYRAYPALVDFNGSGRPDLVVGGADGYLYRYANLGPQPSVQIVPNGLQLPDSFGPPQRITLSSGQTFRTAGFTSVASADMNGNGRIDLVAGSSDGSVVVLLQQDKGVFTAPQPLMSDGRPIRAASHSAPAIGDLDGDGIPDLVVGEASGQVTVYPGIKGKHLQFGKGKPLFRMAAGYAAPSIRDMNGDRKPDLVLGNSEGDLLVYIQMEKGWVPQGPIQGSTSNPMGTKAIVGGQYSVPLWADLNHDGKEDLLVGQISYSKPMPIDDPQFPYRNQLREFLDYAETNKLEIIPHVYVHNFLSSEQEKLELRLQKDSFAALGLPWDKTGTNQHTWRINQANRLQTLRSENDAGIWFNFGFKPANSPTEPQWGRDFLWSFPFLLDDKELRMPMMLHAPGFYFRTGGAGDTTDIYRGFAELDMPIDYFEHIEYHYNDPGKRAMLEQFVQYFDQLRTAHDYNFMSEPQMARSFMAVMTTDYRVSRSWLVYALDTLKSKFGRGLHLTLSVSTDTKGVPDLAAEYSKTAGVIFEPGERYAEYPFATNSPVYSKKESKLYLGLGLKRSTTVGVNWSRDPFHIVRANVPIDIRDDGKVWTIGLLSEGMQQIKLYGPRPLVIEGDDLNIEHDAQNGTYTVTHFGDKTQIVVTMP